MALDFSPSTTDRLSVLVQRFNAGLPAAKQITDDVNFLFSPPVALAGFLGRNTEIAVAIKTGSARRGKIRIRYDRKALESAASGPTGWGEEITSLYALLPSLNAAYGLDLQAGVDVDDKPLTLTTTSLTVKPTSLRYSGTLTFGPSTILSLPDLLTVTELSGFDFPS